MMLLSGCKSKHSDYTPSSGLSSGLSYYSDTVSAFISGPELSIRLLGELIDTQFKYHFQICLRENPQSCKNPLIGTNGIGLQLGRDDLASRLLVDQITDQNPVKRIDYVVREEDGRFKTIDYLNLDELKLEVNSFLLNAAREEFILFIKSKEEFISAYITATKDPLKSSLYELRAKSSLHEISNKWLLKIAENIWQFANMSDFSGWTFDGGYQNDLQYVCHLHPSIGCIKPCEFHRLCGKPRAYDNRRGYIY